MYNYILAIYKGIMATSFVTKLAKSGTDSNGKERRIIIVPSDRVKEVSKNFAGKQVKITIEEI